MTNQALFGSAPRGPSAPPATTTNLAGGKAYGMSPEHSLAQFAVTGTFHSTYYATGEKQFDKALELCRQLPSDYLAKVAIYAHQSGFMKDFPAFLTAFLTTRPDAREYMERVFNQVITNGKMLRVFVQIMRSGAVGRKSLGTGPRRLVRQWLVNASDFTLLNATVGNAPSLADVVKMVHPDGKTPERKALFGWIIGKKVDETLLPAIVREFIAFKNSVTVKPVAQTEEPAGYTVFEKPASAVIPTLFTPAADVPERLPYLLASSLSLSEKQWRQVLRNCTWTNLRMNLATFKREGLFDHQDIIDHVAERLVDEAAIVKTKVFPYQVLTTYQAIQGNVPTKISDAVGKALEIALRNVPTLESDVTVMVDTSQSMQQPVTGQQKSRQATTATKCVDVASLIASAFLAKKPTGTMIVPFDTQCHETTAVVAGNTVMQNAKIISQYGGGGTSVEIPLMAMNGHEAKTPGYFDKMNVLIMVSDNESWSLATGQHAHYGNYTSRYTAMLHEWRLYKQRHPKAKLILIDLTPNTTTQVPDEPGVLNLGGFSDVTFQLIERFVTDQLNTGFWVDQIKAVELVAPVTVPSEPTEAVA